MSDDKRYSTVGEFLLLCRYEWRTRKAWRNWKAAARGLYWSFIRRYPCEICEGCGRRVMAHTGSWWHAPDELWERVRGANKPAGSPCPTCFTKEAERAGIHIYWQPVEDVREPS